MAAKITPPLRLMLDIEAWKDETQLMTAAERGALLALKMFFWRTGPLPDDDAALARIVGMEVKDWRKTRKALEPQFIVKCGEWLREDWNTELDEAYAAVNRAKELSRRGNAARWGRRRESAQSDPAGSPAGSRAGIPQGVPHEILNIYSVPNAQKPQPKTPKPRANDVQPEFMGDVDLAERALGIGGAA